jgi:hypothetical protein
MLQKVWLLLTLSSATAEQRRRSDCVNELCVHKVLSINKLQSCPIIVVLLRKRDPGYTILFKSRNNVRFLLHSTYPNIIIQRSSTDDAVISLQAAGPMVSHSYNLTTYVYAV